MSEETRSGAALLIILLHSTVAQLEESRREMDRDERGGVMAMPLGLMGSSRAPWHLMRLFRRRGVIGTRTRQKV